MQLTNECFIKVKKDYLEFLNKEKIFGKSRKEKIKSLKKFYIPTSFWIDKKYKEKGKTLFLGLSGGQGAGKTTVAKIFKIILKNFFKRKIHISSIDDFYKTTKDRNKIAQKIHPLFKTRGVPGTHDINLIKNFFKVTNKKNFKTIKLPKFNKAKDNRIEKKNWPTLKEKPDIIILEGWCVGAKPQSKFSLKKPINLLEKYEDKNSKWRQHVNNKLRNEYKKLFLNIDYFIFMKIPSFKMVFKWRLLQEKKLRQKIISNKKIMSYNEIKRFIMFYERITLQMIKDLSGSASVLMILKTNHEIKRIIFRS